MADANEKPRPFDLRTIRYLVRLMSGHDLSEIDLSEGDQRIRLRRGPRFATAASPLPAAVPLPAPTHPVPVASAEKPVGKPSKTLLEIKSPTVGTFYAQKDPGSPPFVTVGSRVTPTTIVCIIEAMKVFNELPAECSGVIAEVCIKDKDFVEYNTVLFRVDPEG